MLPHESYLLPDFIWVDIRDAKTDDMRGDMYWMTPATFPESFIIYNASCGTDIMKEFSDTRKV